MICEIEGSSSSPCWFSNLQEHQTLGYTWQEQEKLRWSGDDCTEGNSATLPNDVFRIFSVACLGIFAGAAISRQFDLGLPRLEGEGLSSVQLP